MGIYFRHGTGRVLLSSPSFADFCGREGGEYYLDDIMERSANFCAWAWMALRREATTDGQPASTCVILNGKRGTRWEAEFFIDLAMHNHRESEFAYASVVLRRCVDGDSGTAPSSSHD